MTNTVVNSNKNIGNNGNIKELKPAEKLKIDNEERCLYI